PAWSTATYPSTATTAGQILRADGTNWVASTSTFADTYTAYNILYASSANTVAGLATANSGVLVTSSTGVPSILGLMTNGQLVIGSTGATPVLATLTGSANEIDITNATGSITIGIVNPLTVSKGGTGATTLTGMLKGNTASAFTAITGTADYATYWQDANTIAAEQYLAISRGGTGQNWSAVTIGALPYFSGTGTMSTLGAGTANYLLMANGAAAPSWTNAINGVSIGATTLSSGA
ncbi:unnamed protein product, partial [marine sediment metagenome]